MSPTEISLLDDSRILLLNTPESIRLQLRSRVSWPAKIGLGLVALIGLLILWAVARALLQGGIQNWPGVILATCAGLAFLVGPYLSLVDVIFIYGSERRCLHDLLAGTKVVTVRKS
jgi:hypothetical protein